MKYWITRKCMNDLKSAIQADDKLTYIINIVGDGGIGETVLLRRNRGTPG